MKQLVASPWLHGCCNTVSPSLATRLTRLVHAPWEPKSQACAKAPGRRRSDYGEASFRRLAALPDRSNRQRSCAGTARREYGPGLRRLSPCPAAQALSHNAGSVPGCFPPRNPVPTMNAKKATQIPMNPKFACRGVQAESACNGLHPSRPGDPGAESNAGAVQGPYRQIEDRHAEQLVVKHRRVQAFEQWDQSEDAGAVRRAEDHLSEILAGRRGRIGHQEMQSQENGRMDVGVDEKVRAGGTGVRRR